METCPYAAFIPDFALSSRPGSCLSPPPPPRFLENEFFFFAVLVPSCSTGIFVVAQGLSLWSQLAGFVVLRHVASWFPDSGSNPQPLHWKLDS